MKAVVVGSVNCLCTEYAIVLKGYCDEVIHYHECDRGDLLNNPLKRWGAMSSSLTAGLVLKKNSYRQLFFYLFPRLFKRRLLADINNTDIVFLSGEAISLASSIEGSGKIVVALGYGNDISLFCNPAWPELARSKRRGIKKLLDGFLVWLHASFVKAQVAGLRKCSHYAYFIEGFDPQIDRLLTETMHGSSARRLPRYSMNLSLLLKVAQVSLPLDLGDDYTILFPVRFSSEDKLYGDKGWRLLFDGIKRYKAMSGRKFKCICFKKGDFKTAQEYSRGVSVDDVVEWHEIVEFAKLVRYYKASDVVVEQLGSHWIGQGLWTMALGKPLISKLATAAQSTFFQGSGILDAEDAESFATHLVACESEQFRAKVGAISKSFVEKKATMESEFDCWGLL